jgi:hypothetical protein
MSADEAWKFTPQARVMYLENKRVKISLNTNTNEGWISIARYKWARAIGFSEVQGPSWSFGTHHVDGGVWNAWVFGCANFTRPTRSTRREMTRIGLVNW